MMVSPQETQAQNRLERADFIVRTQLLEMAILSNLRGYNYIIDAVLMAVQDQGVTGAFSSRAYPEIARKRGTTVSNIERCIRSTIKTAWSRSGEKSLQSRFAKLDSPPSAGEFLRYLYYIVSQELKGFGC